MGPNCPSGKVEPQAVQRVKPEAVHADVRKAHHATRRGHPGQNGWVQSILWRLKRPHPTKVVEH
eukprot:6199090-Prymnesium_polylepis.2